MTATMLLILLLLTLFGGTLAYVGDLLGRRLGKQRLSLFGIRPRHTATIITTLMGCLIVALTALSLTLVNESFRAWITRGDRILAELRTNETRLKELQTRNTALQAENQQLATEQRRMSRDLNKLQAEYQAQLRQMQQLEARLQTAERRLRESQAQLRQASEQLNQLRTVRANLQRQIAELRTVIEQLQAFQQKLREQNDLFAEQGAALASENARLDRENRQLREEGERLRAQNQQLAEQNRQLETQNDLLLSRATQLRLQLTDLERATRDLAQLADIRLKPIAVQLGEELARIAIPAGWSEVRVRQAVQNLLQAADRAARARGAAPAASQTRVVFIPEKQVRLATGEQATIDEQGSLEAVVQKVRASGEPVVILAVALTNTAEGEPVPIELRLYRNRKVYEAGEEIARTLLDCRADRNPIGQVLAFLQGEVRTRAIEAGILPRQERAGTPPTVGETSPETLLSLIEQARQCRTERVWLIVRAARTTYASDTLELKFETLPERPAGRG